MMRWPSAQLVSTELSVSLSSNPPPSSRFFVSVSPSKLYGWEQATTAVTFHICGATPPSAPATSVARAVTCVRSSSSSKPWNTTRASGIVSSSAPTSPLGRIETSPPMPTTFVFAGHTIVTDFIGLESKALDASS